ncbi:MAG: HD-GYP domain-containing protein [Gammaproteobacteria bacterium]|nr:HD-GYP domain-containing protein [Gammaproteobacteria bacterium]
MAIKRINADELEVGMYVSRLDRPWRETPFLFQGFHIVEESEIEEIKQQTRHVYILVPDEEIEVGSATRSGSDTGMGHYDEKHARRASIQIEQELPAARKSHREIANLVEEIEGALDSNEELDMARIKRTIGYMVESIRRNPDAYVWLTRIKRYNSYAYNHSLSASVWATAFGRQMELDEQSLNDIAVGTLLMDVGLTRVPNEILQKSSRLTHDEWEVVKTHVGAGMDMLEGTPGISPEIIQLIATHHERLDGSGYPRGLRGAAIPLFGQMAGIVDFYTAITMPRPYMKAVSPSAALQLLYKQRERYFSDKLVNGFIQTLSAYPTGSLVELNTGEVAIVTSQNPGWLLRPKVILLLDPEKQPYGSYPVVNLLEELTDRRGQPLYIVRSLAEGEYDIDVDQISV